MIPVKLFDTLAKDFEEVLERLGLVESFTWSEFDEAIHARAVDGLTVHTKTLLRDGGRNNHLLFEITDNREKDELQDYVILSALDWNGLILSLEWRPWWDGEAVWVKPAAVESVEGLCYSERVFEKLGLTPKKVPLGAAPIIDLTLALRNVYPFETREVHVLTYKSEAFQGMHNLVLPQLEPAQAETTATP